MILMTVRFSFGIRRKRGGHEDRPLENFDNDDYYGRNFGASAVNTLSLGALT
jgi:hypothetical protein